MNQDQAKQKMKDFLGDNKALTFAIKFFPGVDHKWIAQCNEIDSIITCGTGFDQDEMDRLIEDAILTAARIPEELCEGLLKRVWSGETSTSTSTEIDSQSLVTASQSTYRLDYAGAGRI